MKQSLLAIAAAAFLVAGSGMMGASAVHAQDAIEIDGLTGDPAAGEKIYKRCAACHSLEEGKNKVGPTLYGIINAEAGQVPGYKYSKANLESGLTWTPQIMFEYLENPRKYMKGTKMAFPGLKKPQQRVDVIAYIAANGGTAAE